MLTREILNSHPATTLRKEISKTNIKGYSKMKKEQLVDVMMENKNRFSHIEKHDKGIPIKKLFEGPKKEGPKKETKVPAKAKKEAPKKNTKAPKKEKKEEVKEAPKKLTKAQILEDITSIVEYHLQEDIQDLLEATVDIQFPKKEGKVSEIFDFMEKYEKAERKKLKNKIKEKIKESGQPIKGIEDFDFYVLDRKKWVSLI